MRSWLHTYLRPRRFEKDGDLYEALGIRVFLRITPYELLGRLRGGRKPWRLKGPKHARRYFRETISGEIAHLVSLWIVWIGAAILFAKGGRSPAA